MDYTPPNITVETKGGPITLRGLNIDDLGYLARRHGALLNGIFEDTVNVSELISGGTALVADIIACGADDRTAFPVAAQMPFGLQMKLVTHVLDLSRGEIEMGEALAAVLAMVKQKLPPTDPTNSI